MQVPFLDLGASIREIRGEIDAAIRRVVDSARFVLGPELESFEAEFAAYCGARYCVGVGNGLEALRLLLCASGIGNGDEVIVPAQTFIATWMAVSQAGATPVPVDIDIKTGNLDPLKIEAAIGPRTRALILVHLYGRPAEVERIRVLAERHGLLVLEDAAQAHGATYHGRPVGSLVDGAAFSFYPAKNLGALGDGGAVVTGDGGLAERVRLLRNYGSRKKYHHETLATNSRLDEVQAAVLRVKLAHLDEWNRRRRELASEYLDVLTGVEGLALPPRDDEISSAWHLFVVRVAHRDEVQSELMRRGFETSIHYPVPPFLSPPYEHLGWSAESFPAAAQHAATVLSLPFGPTLDRESGQRIASALACVLDSTLRESGRQD